MIPDECWRGRRDEQSRLVTPTLLRYEVVNALHRWFGMA